MTISVLLVDDDIAVKSSTEEFLALSGYNVTSASNAEEALDLLDTLTPDIVITDIMMQEMDGLELTEHIKKNYGAAVIVMTGYSADYSYEEAVNAGASDFIFKPFRFEELDLRINIGISVVGVMDDGVLQPNPVPDYRFNAGDLIAVMGNAQQLAEFQTLISPSQ